LLGDAAVPESTDPWPRHLLDPTIYREGIEKRFEAIAKFEGRSGIVSSAVSLIIAHLGEAKVVDFVVNAMKKALIDAGLINLSVPVRHGAVISGNRRSVHQPHYAAFRLQLPRDDAFQRGSLVGSTAPPQPSAPLPKQQRNQRRKGTVAGLSPLGREEPPP
jgi:hypothetical protein